MPERPVVRYVVITAAVTAVVSGLIASMINNHVSRAKPHIIVNSVGFRGPLQDEPVELPDGVLNLSAESPWLDELQRFETYDKLVKADQEATEVIAQLEQAIASIRAWEKQNVTAVDPGAEDRIPAAAFLQHPLVKESVVGQKAIGLIRRRALGAAPPKDIAALNASSPSYEIYPDPKNTAWLLDMGERSMQIPFEGVSASSKSGLELFVQSIAHRSRPNVKYYSDRVIDSSREDILQLQDFQKQLRAFLLPRACLSAVVSVHNAGKTPITFRPFFSLRLLHPDYKGRAFVMASENAPDKRKNPFALTSNGFTIQMPREEVAGKKVLAKPFLAGTSASPYMTIPPGEVREITLVATEPLGTDAEGIKRIHETKLLGCRVVGTSSDSDDIWSAPTEFSEQIGKDEKARLAALVPPRWW